MTRVNQDAPEPEPTKVIDAEDLKLYTVKQVASIFQVGEYTIRSWLKDPNGLRGTKMGRGTTGHWRVTGQEIVRFANERFGSEVKHVRHG